MVDEIDITLPLTSYSFEFKSIVSKLDPKRILTTNGPIELLRDWRGLAFLLGIPNDISSGISEGQDRTAKVIDLWIQRNDDTATLGNLLDYLAQIDRFDIYDDLVELAKRGRLIAPQRPLANGNELAMVNGDRHDSMIITHDDRRDGFPNYYHAYVLFAQEDWSFVRELLSRMKALKFKLCTEYDIEIGYGTQYAPVAQLISERCHRIILVYSPDFLHSPANTFYSDYAQAVGIESNKRNIIPIVYRECRLPHNLMYYHKLVYNKQDEWMPYDFWEKLAQTLDKVKLPNTYSVPLSQLESTSTSTNDLRNQFLTLGPVPTSGSDTLELCISELNQSIVSNSSVGQKKKRKGFTKVIRYFSDKLKG